MHWLDDAGEEHTLNQYDQYNNSKGLKQIAIELGFEAMDVNRCKLKELREKLICHPAFIPISKLEIRAKKYNVKIIFCPKFHCELKSIEGLWCDIKWFVRKHTDQTFQKMIYLIPLTKDQYKNKNLNIKLIRRFWNCLLAYEAGKTYGEVLRIYFGNKNKEKIECHRRILENNKIQ